MIKTILIEDHRHDDLRSGEGSAVALRDGRLLLHYSHFTGAKDDDPACIVARISHDNGESWGERTLFAEPPEGAQNVMGASLLRLADGRLGSIYSIKWGSNRCIPQWSVSSDDGEHWSPPKPLSQKVEYLVTNNDRLIQLRDGMLVLPYARHQDLSRDDQTLRPAVNGDCGLFYSRDGGETWCCSAHTVRHRPDCFRPPLFETPETKRNLELREVQEARFGIFQEPGVVELADGRPLLHVRSLYAMYLCVTSDVASAWVHCGVLDGFNVPLSPQTIRRLPGGKRLVMLYNDRRNLAWGEPRFQWRTPLSVAVSDDEARTWIRLGALTDEGRNYCYWSFVFFDEGKRFLITGYESAEVPRASGVPGRRNLASLRAWTGLTSVFEGDGMIG